LVAKLDPQGVPLWAKRLGGDVIGYSDAVASVAIDGSNNVYVMGTYSGTINCGGGALVGFGSTDVFVAKYAPDGTYIWSKNYGGTGVDQGAYIAVSTLGTVAAVGIFHDAVDFGDHELTAQGGEDVFLLRLDPASGTTIESKAYGDIWNDGVTAVGFDQSGNIFIAGQFVGSINFGPTVGDKLNSVGLGDAYLAKLASDGSHVWSERYGGTRNQAVLDMAIDDNNNVLLVGSFEDFITFDVTHNATDLWTDMYVAKIAGSGSPTWSKSFGGAYGDTATGVGVLPSGDLFISGLCWSSIDFGTGTNACIEGDVVFARLAANDGAVQWGQVFMTTETDVGGRLAIGGSQHVILSGLFEGDLTFGATLLSSAGGTDIFVAKFEN